MTNTPTSGLRILLLEDNTDDAELINRVLRTADPNFTIRTVSTGPDFAYALDSFIPDVVLSDHAVAAFNAYDALQLTQARLPASAFLLVAGSFEQTASDCLKAGAADFISKADLDRLVPAISTAVTLRAPLRKLSQRQHEVLSLLAHGSSTREIAGKLNVSVKTIETHRAQVMRRLGIRDVAGLVRFAIRVGLVSANR